MAQVDIRKARFGKVALAAALLGTSLVGCAPSQSVRPVVYQAPLSEVSRSILDASADLTRLPSYQALFIWPEKTKVSEIVLASAERITALNQHQEVLIAGNDRELKFILSEKSGGTEVSVSRLGPVDKQAEAILKALDAQFNRVQP